MSVLHEHTRLTLLHATRELARAARRTAASKPLGSEEHDFYAGVNSAAESRLHPGRAAADDRTWLARHPRAFRDGYMKAEALISVAVATGASHVPLPQFAAPARRRAI